MIGALTNLHFIRPWWLALIPVVLGLWWLWQRNADPLRGWRQQIEPEFLQALVVGRHRKGMFVSYLLLAAWLLAVLAIAGPTWRLEPNPFADDAEPLMILLKADQSMNQPPPSPSRIERAHLKIADLADLRKGQPLGLIAYAGSSHMVLPPTSDTDIVAEMADEISPEIMPEPGDRLDLAIQKASELLQSENQGGSLLIIADSAQIDPKAVAQVARDNSLPVQILALSAPDSPERESLEEVASALDASVQSLTVDDQDVVALVDFAERSAGTAMAGESSRWQEAGYWLTPALALIVLFSFRREQIVAAEETP